MPVDTPISCPPGEATWTPDRAPTLPDDVVDRALVEAFIAGGDWRTYPARQKYGRLLLAERDRERELTELPDLTVGPGSPHGDLLEWLATNSPIFYGTRRTDDGGYR
jgi:hypothetical protein